MLHNEGWTKLPDGMPEWELRRYVEDLYRRYHQRIYSLLDARRRDWHKGDSGSGEPGAWRMGGLVAKQANKALKGTGLYLYAAHPSQADDAEEDEYTGPRWYVTCLENMMKHFGENGEVPLPPPEACAVLWPRDEDRRKRPWLTEAGWTVVPENSQPQVLHADVCWKDGPHPRRRGQGRYHHFAWKLDPKSNCTTNVVPRGFTEGCTTWEHYEKVISVKAPAFIFDSEMLHRGAQTAKGSGFSSTLTLQVCSGKGLPALKERISANMMWYTLSFERFPRSLPQPAPPAGAVAPAEAPAPEPPAASAAEGDAEAGREAPPQQWRRRRGAEGKRPPRWVAVVKGTACGVEA